MSTPAIWLVYSVYHKAWWGANHRGYYIEVGSAGRYTRAEAEKICKMRSPLEDGTAPEIMVPAPEAADVIEAIDALRAEEAECVEILPDDVEGPGGDDMTGVEVTAGWTNWEPRRFKAATWMAAAIAAAKAKG